jgi:hypothetical protein
MTLQERIENRPSLHALPLWRRLVLICGLGFFVLVGAMIVDKQFDIYGGDPDHPVVATGHIYPVHVNHGYLRYATKEERDSLIFWENKMGAWIGLPALGSVFLWLLYRPKRPSPASLSQ